MVCRQIKQIEAYKNAYTFVKENNLEKKFKEKFDETIEEWTEMQFMADADIISEILDERKEEYVVDYDSNSDCLIVYELKPQKTGEERS